MRLGFGRNPRLWQIFEICNLEMLAWWVWIYSITCDRFDVALYGIVSIRPWLLMKLINILKETMLYWLMDNHDSWRLVQEGVDLLSLKYNYLLYLWYLFVLYYCLSLLLWLLLILLACVFEYLDTSSLLINCDKWILLEDHIRCKKKWIV